MNEQQAVSTTQMMKTPNQVVMLEKQVLTNPMLIGFLLEKISVTVSYKFYTATNIKKILKINQ